MADFRDVDPAELRVPGARKQGADPAKLARQISLFGRSSDGMPPLWVYEAADSVLVLYNGVTRATRVAKLSPGTSFELRWLANYLGHAARCQRSETCSHDTRHTT